ncbi:tRNA-specific adenosine deaminase [Kocuria tytonicola]|uniref:Nucleoside deaminase n=1 Tax=Kocuria tytonicola TaxID=2055946 RepID=A0A3L9M0L8_9MICC|nr:nucleoside deaminase [Kocuria tytonicola]RLY93717.1 nucleoside deaminase [Kocuria tytonicola]RLZ03108.1 tRNA-specific adenosine deaminase [Kocuria tytonicola]
MTHPPAPDAVRRHLRTAVQAASRNASRDGGPFGAVLVTADGREFTAVNRVTADHDPTAHAEVSAIRSACAALGTFDLSGAVLYSSCEPCPMCLSASLWARLDAVHFAADRHDAADGGFDDAAFYDFFTATPAQRDELLPVRHVALAERNEPFEAWAENGQRTQY